MIVPLIIGIVVVMTGVVACIAYCRIRAQGHEQYKLDGVMPDVAEGSPRFSKNRTPAQAMLELRAQMFRERARVPAPNPSAIVRRNSGVGMVRYRDVENSTGTLPEGFLSSENSAGTAAGSKVNENSRSGMELPSSASSTDGSLIRQSLSRHGSSETSPMEGGVNSYGYTGVSTKVEGVASESSRFNDCGSSNHSHSSHTDTDEFPAHTPTVGTSGIPIVPARIGSYSTAKGSTIMTQHYRDHQM